MDAHQSEVLQHCPDKEGKHMNYNDNDESVILCVYSFPLVKKWPLYL